MRADRLLQILLILQAHGRTTAGQLAERLEVSVRTIQRDMDALSAAGVPVFAMRGGEGGWALVDGFRTTLTGLTPSEALAVAIARPRSVLRDLGLDDGGEVGMLKVMAALPALAQQAAEHARQRVHVDLEPWAGPSGSDRDILRALWQATTTDTIARIRYGASKTQFDIEPFGLVAKGAVWYLIAKRTDALRTYRAARVARVELTEEHFDRPADFDLAEHWTQVCIDLPKTYARYEVSLRVTHDGLQRLRWTSGAPVSARPTSNDGWTPVRVNLESIDEATPVVLGLGGDVIVDTPAALRTAVRRAATRLLSRNDR